MENVKFAMVEFSETPGREYAFFTDMKVLKDGDKVVVDTAVGIKIAEFKRYVDEFPFAHARKAKWIVQKVDMFKLNGFRGVNVEKILASTLREQKKKEIIDQMDFLEGKLSELQKQLSEL